MTYLTRITTALAPHIEADRADERARNIMQAVQGPNNAWDIVQDCLVDHWSLAGFDIPGSVIANVSEIAAEAQAESRAEHADWLRDVARDEMAVGGLR